MNQPKNEVRPPKVGEYVAFIGLVYQVKKIQVKMGKVKSVTCKPMCTLDEFMREITARKQLEAFNKQMQEKQAEPKVAGEEDVVVALGG